MDNFKLLKTVYTCYDSSFLPLVHVSKVLREKVVDKLTGCKNR
jgi:hypothetical protein